MLFVSVLYFLFLSLSMSLRFVVGTMQIPRKYTIEERAIVELMSIPRRIAAAAIGIAKCVSPTTIASPSTTNLAEVLYMNPRNIQRAEAISIVFDERAIVITVARRIAITIGK